MITIGWQKYIAPPIPVQTAQTTPTQDAPISLPKKGTDKLNSAGRIKVSTDVLDAEIDKMGGDLRLLAFKNHKSTADSSKPFLLFNDKKGQTYAAQTGLLSDTIANLPTHKTIFSAEETSYTLNGDKVEVKLIAPAVDGVTIEKIYTFTKGSYIIDVKYNITNNNTKPLSIYAYYRLLRDGQAPEGEGRLAHTFTGPGLYTPEHKFQKISFSDLDTNKAVYPQHPQSGWIAMIQHYFVSAWILQPHNQPSVCQNAQSCTFEIKALPDSQLYSAATSVKLPVIAPGNSESFSMILYAGPQYYDVITKVAEGLERTKDYGWVHIIASPLFWLLTKLHTLVSNWGWAIVLLTLTVKAVLYPLNAASYRSMAKMRAVAPRLEALKKEYGDDRMKLQQEMMALYKTEKINPLGGCLPILLQIPVFFGLYSALLASVELRGAPWILWIHDLARPDPWFILPGLMAATMFIQTFLNPPPADPIQAKMMKIMPIAFSIMFFFFPAGLVLYWLVNNILSIAQQWLITRKIEHHASKSKRA